MTTYMWNSKNGNRWRSQECIRCWGQAALEPTAPLPKLFNCSYICNIIWQSETFPMCVLFTKSRTNPIQRIMVQSAYSIIGKAHEGVKWWPFSNKIRQLAVILQYPAHQCTVFEFYQVSRSHPTGTWTKLQRWGVTDCPWYWMCFLIDCGIKKHE